MCCKPGEGLIAGVEELEGRVQTQFHLIHPGKGGGGEGGGGNRKLEWVHWVVLTARIIMSPVQGVTTDPDGIAVHVYTIHGWIP